MLPARYDDDDESWTLTKLKLNGKEERIFFTYAMGSSVVDVKACK